MLNWETSFAPGVGAVAPRSVSVCARVAPAKIMTTPTASAIFGRTIFAGQDWKLKHENAET